jgi:hypothetical protein
MPVHIFERKLGFANPTESVESNSVIILIREYLAEFAVQLRQQI